MPPERMVTTPHGDARLVVRRARRATSTLVLTHGAGGGIDAPDLTRLATTLPASGVSVMLVEMPWRVAGKKLAPRPAVIDECFRAVLARLRPRTPLVIGGRSAGARSACRIASEIGAAGVLALAFPLHPPGKPEKSRLDELAGAGVPTLVLQGERDPFGAPGEYPPAEQLPGVRVVPVPYADHSLKVPKSAPVDQDEVLGLLQETALEWLSGQATG